MDGIDFFFEDSAAPSTSQCPTSAAHGDSNVAEDTDHDSSLGPSSVSMPQIPENETSSKIDYISGRVQELVKKINISRTNDQEVMDTFQEKLTEQVVGTSQLMKEHMYTVYEKNSNEMQAKLQELTEVLENCTKLNSELQEANQALTSLREGLGINKSLQSP